MGNALAAVMMMMPKDDTPMDRFDEIFRTTPKAERLLWLDTLLQVVVHQMVVADASHDMAQIRALVNQAGNPKWRGERLPLKRRFT